MQHLRFRIIGTLLLAACSSPQLFVEVPRRPGTKTIVFGVHAPDGLSAYAFDAADDSVALELELENDAAIPIEALLYGRNPAELGISPGLLIPSDELSPLPT